MPEPNHFDLLQAYAEKVGLPDNTNDDDRREFTYGFAQQLRFSYPQDGEWGCKQEGTNPQSADLVMLRGHSVGIDTSTGVAGNPQTVLKWAEVPLTANARFIAVEPHDYLGTTPPPDPPPDDDLENRVALLESQVRDLETKVGTLETENTLQGAALVTLQQRVTALEQAPVSGHTHEILDTRTGSNGGWLGHSHPVKVLGVKP